MKESDARSNLHHKNPFILNGDIEDNTLTNAFQKKWPAKLLMALILTGILLLSYVFWGNCNIFGYQSLRRFGNWLLECIQIRDIIIGSVDDYCNMAITYNTILTAAVVFFYSILDNQRMGVPYRTIISYTFGSYSMPVLFMITLLGAFFIYPLLAADRNIIAFVIATYIFLVQSAIIFMILISTSFRYCVKVITQIEILQYEKLKEYSEKKEYIWLYFLRHLELSVQSNEISTDKVKLLHSILWVPFCKKEKFIIIKKHKPSYECLKENNETDLYRFYYENLMIIFPYLSGEENYLKRNKFYLVLYEFIERFEQWYQHTDKEKEKGRECFTIIVSGIINAVLMSRTEEREAVCRHILNCCISDKQIQKRQTDLYFLFWQVVFALGGKLKMHTISADVECLKDWQWTDDNDIDFYSKYWHIWMSMYILPLQKQMEFFEKAIVMMKGISNSAGPVAYIILRIEQMRKD